MSFSLVITTYNRYETFLKQSLTRYLQNPHISEIVVYDDCSGDYESVVRDFPSVRAFTQQRNVGALRNKVAACREARGEWICLMDSDNYCGPDYFEALLAFWNEHSYSMMEVYAPVFARPNFNYKEYIGKEISPRTWNSLIDSSPFTCLANTGNCVFHKSMVANWDAIPADINPYAIDALYMLFLLVAGGASLVVVPSMEYDHCVHGGSFYINTSTMSQRFIATHNWTISTTSA